MNRRYVFEPPPLRSLAVAGSELRFPVRRIYCVGRNYREHIREMGGDEREPPFFFQKPADALVEDSEMVPYPRGTVDFQHEVEIVLAIGRGGTGIDVHTALDHVFGFAVGIDLTRRDLQLDARSKGRPWEAGKSFDRSAPCSAIRKMNEVGSIGEHELALHVNGQLRQRGNAREMIWSCAEVVSKLSEHYALAPGDLIFSGTPAGVAALQRGDRVLASCGSIGKVEVTIGA